MLKARKYVGLESLPPSYSELFAQASKQSFFLSLPWFQNFERTVVGQNDTVLVYGVEEEAANDPCPRCALVLQQKRGEGGLLRLTTVEAMSNYYTSYFGPAMSVHEGDIAQLSSAFVSGLWQDRKSWDVINLRPLDPQSPIFTTTIQAFRELGMAVQTYFCFGNWYLEVGGRSYEEYFQTLPKGLRKNIPYETRKLEKTGRVRIELVTDAQGLEQALDDYEKVYNTSWRIPEPYPDFIRGLARTAAANGWLRLGVLYLNDEPAAAQLWIVHAGVASIYKICYQEQFATLSVGKILTTRMMQHALDVDKVSEVDYLSGDDAYKKDWMSHRRERWGIMAFNLRTVKGLMQATGHIGGRFAKRAFLRLHERLRGVDQNVT